MASIKGTSLIYLRKAVKDKGDDFHESFVASLSEQEKTAFKSALAFSWVPLEVVASIYEKGIARLYAGDRIQALRQFGRDAGRDDMKGIYRVAMRFSSVEFLMEQAAKVWGTYFDGGKVSTERRGKGDFVIQLDGLSGFPEVMRHTVEGGMESIIATAGAKQAKVRYQSGGGDKHRWVASWG